MNGWTLLFPLCYACLSSFLLAHTSSPFLSLMNHGLTHFEYLHPESIQILLYPSDTPLVLLSFSAYQHDFQFLLTPSHLLHSNASIFTSFKMNQSDLNDSLSDQFYTTSLHDELTIFKGYGIENFLNPHGKGMDTPTRFHADRILTTKHSSQTNPIHAHFIFHVPLKQFTSNTFQIKDWISRPFFEGYFEWQHEEYSVTSIPTYQLQKRDVDIHVPDPQHRLHPQAQLSQLMVYRTLKDRAMTFTNTTPTHFHCGTNTENTRITMLEDPPPHLFHLDSFHTISNLTSPSLKKRQGNRGCPTSKKILYMGIALDCTYVKLRGGATLARTQVLRNFLKISALYENTFNIQIGITEIQLFESCNTPLFNRPCDPSITMLRRLSEFSQWRSSISKDAGLWHLFSECNQGSTVGLAWTGVLCRTDANLNVDMAGSEAYVSGTGVSAPGSKFATDAEWLISAHEIGHNFGARHDCTSQSDCSASNCCGCTESLCNKCDRSYLMNPTSDGASAIFSPCSQKDICTKNQVSGACLQEPGQRKMITIAQCGNGIVEDGEECDCGGNMCPNACCGLDCKLKSNAVCDDASHACCKNCQLASTGTVCRSATGPCDYTEYCNGTSKYCPPDIFLPNGEACSISTNSSGTCTSGQCTTRDFQCILQTIGSFDGYNEITGACDSTLLDSCILTCKTKNQGCVYFNSNFLDGTPCGRGGMCYSGNCQNEDFLGKLIQWVVRYPHWAGLSLLGILLVLFTLIHVFKKISILYRNRKNTQAQALPLPSNSTLPSS